jgi:ornithine cyclodeaminase/alanine dehydrogenase-like protein (mu-crystallin family)
MKQISATRVAALNVDISEIAQALDFAFRSCARGAISWKPKSMIAHGDGSFLMSTFASWPEAGYGLFHMLSGAVTARAKKGYPAYGSTQVLTDAISGDVLAVADGAHTSTVLPAGITRLMTPYLARSKSGIAVVIGAGTQARVNLAALDGVLPIKEVRIASRTTASAQKFADFVHKRGQTARVMDVGAALFKDADIIITTVPASPDLQPFLDPSWVPEGAFVNAVDLGRSWLPGFSEFDSRVVDDREQAKQQYIEGRIAHNVAWDSDIPELLIAAKGVRQGANERTVLLHPGNVVGILALTVLFYRKIFGT